MAKKMFKDFRVTDAECEQLRKNLGYLCKYAAWQLIKHNGKNNHTDEVDDIEQELLIAVLRAAVYYKRQTYIESCLDVAKKHAQGFNAYLVDELKHLWETRKQRGRKSKFAEIQEDLLEKIVQAIVPKEEIPDRNRPLIIDKVFTRYCKQIAWNQQKNLGKKITRERKLRTSLVSLSEFEDCLSNMEKIA